MSDDNQRVTKLIYSPLDFLGEIVGRILIFGLVIGAIAIISNIFKK